METNKKPNWGCIFMSVLVLFWIVVGILAIIRHFQEEAAGGTFTQMTEEVQTACGLCFSQASEETELRIIGKEYHGLVSPYLHGKVLVVEANTGEAIGSSMLNLPEDIAAQSPDEVDTLICSGEIDQFKSHTYSDNQPGYTLTRDFCFYDLSLKKVIFTVHLLGSSPPAIKQGSGPEDGNDPAHFALIDFLETLPRD